MHNHFMHGLSNPFVEGNYGFTKGWEQHGYNETGSPRSHFGSNQNRGGAVGRPSGATAKRKQLENTLRVELQLQIERGQCAYCRAPAAPDRPLTREHVIPRARGGRRNDLRIIVPACLRCNSHRGCAELIPFLLSRPTRISSFIDYLSTLSHESLRQLDPRIFAELYAAVAILRECTSQGSEWRQELLRLSSGRSLHRRRHAARRAIWAVSLRFGESRYGGGADDWPADGPTCALPATSPRDLQVPLDEPLERLIARLVGVLAVLWSVSAERAEGEMARALAGTALQGDATIPALHPGDLGTESDDVLPLDGWRARPRRRRLRVDRRQGRVSRTARGRAA